MNARLLPRLAVYGLLLLAAFFFLAPLYVMLVTSFKDAAAVLQERELLQENIFQLGAEAVVVSWVTISTALA